MTFEKIYTTVPETNIISDAAIAYSQMLMVSREGSVLNIKESNNDIPVTNREVLYQPALGNLVFNDQMPFNEMETIQIVYKTL